MHLTVYGRSQEHNPFWHHRSLISARFIIHSLEGVIVKVAACFTSLVQLVSGAEQAGLNIASGDNARIV